MATQKQLDLARDLAEQVDMDVDEMAWEEYKKDSFEECTVEEASEIIQLLLDERQYQRELGHW